MPANSESLTKGLEAMSRFFVGDASLRDMLHRVSVLAGEAVGADMVGITMLVDGRARTAVFTDDTAPEIDAAHYETGIGPCLDAFRSQQVFRIDNMEKDEQWAPFSEAVAARGIVASMSLPLVARDEGIGALTMYSRRAAFSDDDVSVACSSPPTRPSCWPTPRPTGRPPAQSGHGLGHEVASDHRAGQGNSHGGPAL